MSSGKPSPDKAFNIYILFYCLPVGDKLTVAFLECDKLDVVIQKSTVTN